MSSKNNDQFSALLQVNGKGWNQKLFISKIPDVCVCKSCNNVCKDAMELGCDHEDDEIDAFCKQCLATIVESNNNQCPINASHKNPPVLSARTLRKQILTLQVCCPNGKKYANRKDGNNMVYDTSDEKEGGNINDGNNDKNQCDWCGTLKELIIEHIQNCTAFSEDIIMGKIKYLTQTIGDLIDKVDKSKNHNNSIISDLNSKVDGLKENVNALSELLKQQQRRTDEQFSNLRTQMHNIEMRLQEKDNEINELKKNNDDEKKKAEEEPYYSRYTSVVHNFDASELLQNGWKCVYDKPYSHTTTSEELQSLCENRKDIEVFVGGAHKDSKSRVILGAFGPSSVLHRITNEKTTAFIPKEVNKNVYKVYWYHNRIEGMKSFGFASMSKVHCSNPDTVDENGDDRLSWYVYGHSQGGYRLGMMKNLNNNDYYKIVYIKQR